MKLTLEAVAALTGGKILSGDPELTVFGVASLLDASHEEASFLGNEKYFEDFLHTSAGIVLVPPALPAYPENVAFVEVDNPSMAFNALVKYFMASAYRFTPGIHPTAIIDPTATFNPDKIHVGAYTCIGAHCVIGDGTDIGNGCDIGDGVTIGENCRLHAHVIIRERCKLGSRVTIQPGAVIGSDGFGFLMGDNGRYVGIDQVGIVELGDDVDVGANTTIDRARFGRTIVGEGTKIDNLIQLGHNVVVGKHCVIVAQSGIAGSTQVGDYATIAAQVGISGHLKIGSKSVLGAKTGVISTSRKTSPTGVSRHLRSRTPAASTPRSKSSRPSSRKSTLLKGTWNPPASNGLSPRRTQPAHLCLQGAALRPAPSPSGGAGTVPAGKTESCQTAGRSPRSRT